MPRLPIVSPIFLPIFLPIVLPMAMTPSFVEPANPLRRSCGECRACCTCFHIEDLDKVAGEPCGYLDTAATGGGCAIHGAPLLDWDTWYDSPHFDSREHGHILPIGYRPRCCGEFSCAWREGELTDLVADVDIEDLRPDRCGMIVTANYVVPQMPRYRCSRADDVTVPLRLARLTEPGRALYRALHGTFGDRAGRRAFDHVSVFPLSVEQWNGLARLRGQHLQQATRASASHDLDAEDAEVERIRARFCWEVMRRACLVAELLPEMVRAARDAGMRAIDHQRTSNYSPEEWRKQFAGHLANRAENKIIATAAAIAGITGEVLSDAALEHATSLRPDRKQD